MKKTYSWAASIIWYFLFFPIGLYLIFSKMKNEPQNSLKNGKILKIFGWIAFALGPFYFLIWLSGELNNVTGEIAFVVLFFIITGLFMVFKSKGSIQFGERLEKYPSIIASASDLNIGNIAALAGTDENTAIADLKCMIAFSMLDGYSIDFEKNCLVKAESTEQNSQREKTYVIKCPHCGATNSIEPGEKAVCRYCDSPLKLE
jgi:DNA-directed RNA polymerase subunit RPC12/RpoP